MTGFVSERVKNNVEGRKMIFTKLAAFSPSLFTTQSRLLMTLYKKSFESNVEKGETAGNQHFLLIPQCFLPLTQ